MKPFLTFVQKCLTAQIFVKVAFINFDFFSELENFEIFLEKSWIFFLKIGQKFV
jgi:hypothetical protein